MALSNEERIQKLEELLSRVEGRRERGAEPAAEPERVSEPEVLDLAESDDVIELTDEDEEVVVVGAAAAEDDIPMIPEEFEEPAPEPEPPPAIEVVAEPEAPMQVEPLAPVEPIDVLPPGAPEIMPAMPEPEPEEPVETTLELHPTEPRKKPLPPTQAMPVVPEPVEPEPPPTSPQPVVPEPAPLERTALEAAPDMGDARPVAIEGQVPAQGPRTIGALLRAAFRVGEK